MVPEPNTDGLPEFPAEPAQYPETSQATTVLILGIAGLIVSILAPLAWFLANQELQAIDSGMRPPDNRDSAKIGRILGIIGTVLLVVAAIALALLIAAFRSFVLN